MKRFFCIFTSSSLLLISNSCMQQTVRDASGEILYQEQVVGTPWQSNKTTLKQVEERESELGLR